MRLSHLVPMLFALLLTGSCGRDDAPPASGSAVELNFKGLFGAAPLLMYERAYPYEASMAVKFQLFQFYISDVTLIPAQAGGKEVPLLDIGLVSFKDVQSDDAARQGVTIRTKEAPPGSYSGVRFGIGVSPVLNATQPGNYTPGHPLTDNYWSWATGYVFFKIEGNADKDGDGNFTDKLTFHIGLNDFYRTKTFEQPIEVKSGQAATVSFKVDLHRVLASDAASFVDFRRVTQDHTNDRDLARFLADNLKEAVIVDR